MPLVVGHSNVGVLAGSNAGEIENIHMNKIKLYSGSDNAGGITGINTGTIAASYVKGDIQSRGDKIGCFSR